MNFRQATLLIISILVLVVGLFALERLPQAWLAPYQSLITFTPYFVLILVAGAAWTFHHVNVVLVSFFWVSCTWLIDRYLLDGIHGALDFAHFFAISVSLMLFSNALSWVPARISWGWRLSLMASAVLSPLLLFFWAEQWQDSIWSWPLLWITAIHRDAWLPIGIVILALPVILVLGVRFVRKGGLLDALLVAQPLVILAVMFYFERSSLSDAFLAFYFLLFLFAIIQTAYLEAYRDQLTQIPSRRALNAKLNALGSRYTLVMVDVDHFKKFNDTYGHDIGDQVLRMVASQLARVQGGGHAFRYGGEEFTLVFSGKTAEQAREYAEVVRSGIAEYPMAIRRQGRPSVDEHGIALRGTQADLEYVNITVSMGMAARTAERSSSDEVLKAADRALYQAKNKGRNRLEIVNTHD